MKILSLNSLWTKRNLLSLYQFPRETFLTCNHINPESGTHDSLVQNLYLFETTVVLTNACSCLCDRHGALCFMPFLPFYPHSKQGQGLLRICPFTKEEAEAEFKPLSSKGPSWPHSPVLSVFRFVSPLNLLTAS